jgi:FKBP-type peptidyl-prolyl cis-trans isomerase SlyD
MKQKVVSFHYTLKDSSGAVLESSHGQEPMSYLEGVGQIIPGLERQLHGLQKGDKKAVQVPAADAYGEYDEALVVEVPRQHIPKKDVQVGDQFHAQGEDGDARVVVVTEVTDKTVTVDANHPLSGQDLHFDVEVTEVRDATAEEVEHGHAHGAGGHHH